MCKWKTNHLPIFLQINVCPLGNIFYLNTSSQGADTEKKMSFTQPLPQESSDTWMW